MTADNKTYFQPGGSLPADAPTYIIRNADNKLYSLLLEGKFSYVLTARQMGKSSLRVRIANQLSNEGIASVNIDLTNIGSVDTTTDQWYYSLLSRMCRNLDISIKLLRQWWRENQELSPVNRFSSFIEEVLLEETTKPIVIFIDEIDYILSLDRGTFSTDDFFAVIRHCYNSRADNPEYARLTFCLLGVATPNDLMQDPSRTPFNVGYQVELDMLTVESASPLLNGLEDLTIPPLEILPEIISWTGGHPYLTQKICHHIASKSETIKDLADLNNVIQELFLSEDADDHNLKNVNNRILLHKKYNVQMLELLQILFKGKIIESNDKDYTQIYLKLSGLIKISKNKLVVSNKIYQKAFDQKWLNNALAKIKRPFAEDMQRWIDLGKSTSAALRGEVLQHALRWSETRDDLTPNEYEYLSFSRMVQQDEQAKEVELLYADKLKIRNRFLIGALVMSLIAGGAAIYYSFEAKKNERIATSHFQTLKKSLTDLGENNLCHLGIVELFNNDKDLYSTMLTTSVNNALESRFTKLKKSIRVSSVMSKDDYSDYIKSIESVKIIIPKKTREQFPDLVNSILASKNMKNQEKNSWFEKLPNMNQSRISELTKILASENSKQKDKKNSSNDKKPNSSKENTEISKKK